MNVSEILSLRQGREWSEEDVRRVVAENDKQRFALRQVSDGPLQIRANQGHTLQVSPLLYTVSCEWLLVHPRWKVWT